MAASQNDNEDKTQATFAGCLLMILSLAVLFGSAVPIVTWRNPDTGKPLPRIVAIGASVLSGALCYGIGSGILRIVGLPVSTKPETDSLHGPDHSDDPPSTKET